MDIYINKETEDLFDKSLFIVELHHQYIGNVWIADDRDEFVKICKLSKGSRMDTPESDDYQDWVDYMSNDLRGMPILTLAEAIDYIATGKDGSQELLDCLTENDIV